MRDIAYIFLSSFLLLVQGCVFDRDGCPDDLPPYFEEPDVVGYISVKLVPADGMTRAVGDGFDYGNKDEFLLCPGDHHFVIFYNEEQASPLAVAAISGMTDREGSDKTANSTVALAAIAAKSEQKDLLERFQEGIVILNASLDPESLWTVTKERLLETIVDSPFCTDDKGNRYFTMCNSVYVDGGKAVVSSKIDVTKIYTSYLEAIERAWNGEAALEACVERVAAKISLRFEDETLNRSGAERVFVPDDNKMIVFSHLDSGFPHYESDYSYKIRITGWGMNGLEKESMLFRNFNVNGDYFDRWYDTALSRAYWSEDCNYEAASYPWQYRKAVDRPDMPYYEGKENTLLNLPFTDLNSGFFGKDMPLYVPENTWDFKDARFKTMLDSRPELLAGTHAIVCAELLTNLDDRSVHVAKDIYRDRNGNFYRSERECFKALVTAFSNSLDSHAFLRYTYYDWENGGGEQTLFAWTKGEYSLYLDGTKLTLDNIDRLSGELMTDATVRQGDGKRFIWMDKMMIRNDISGEAVQIYSNIDEVDHSKDMRLRSATPDDIKSILLEYIGPVDHFADGKMYYPVPIGYIGNGTVSDNGSDVYSVYGVVRNSVYDIVLHDVTGLGTPVDDESEPIVPNTIATNDHLFISIGIIGWHDIDQKVPGVVS